MINYAPLPATGVAHVAGPALARLLISDDNERNTHADVLQELDRDAQAP